MLKHFSSKGGFFGVKRLAYRYEDVYHPDKKPESSPPGLGYTLVSGLIDLLC